MLDCLEFDDALLRLALAHPQASGFTTAVYAELLRRAEHALRRGEMVVLDASWTDDAHRADAHRIADETAADLIELRCVAPADTHRRPGGRPRRSGR